MCRCVCECAYLHDKTKTHDHNDVKLGTVVFLDTVSQPAGFGFKRSRSWLGLGLDSGRRFASTESAHTFSSLLVISVPKSIENMRPQNRQPALLTYDTFDLRVKTYIFRTFQCHPACAAVVLQFCYLRHLKSYYVVKCNVIQAVRVATQYASAPAS